MKGAFIAFGFAVVVIAVCILFDWIAPSLQCDAGSPHGPRIGGAMLLYGCP